MVSNDAYGPVLICEFDISIIGQIAKQETGHALGLGQANFDGSLMAETVNDGTSLNVRLTL
jgi:hypothetical protein